MKTDKLFPLTCTHTVGECRLSNGNGHNGDETIHPNKLNRENLESDLSNSSRSISMPSNNNLDDSVALNSDVLCQSCEICNQIYREVSDSHLRRSQRLLEQKHQKHL